MKTFLYLSDIHSNFEALKHLDSLPEMQDPDCEIRFGGDYIDGVDLEPNALRSILQNNNVINITSETDEAYSFIEKGHVYQIPKTIVEQK